MKQACIALVLLLLSGIESADAAQKRPNLVVILTDDQAEWSLGCYGNKESKSPSIDRLALAVQPGEKSLAGVGELSAGHGQQGGPADQRVHRPDL
jgi:hypothetical protein